MALETRLKPTWDWILNVMDATEAQLRFGASLTNSTDASHPLHPLHLGTQPVSSAPASALSGLNVLGGSSQPRTRLIDPTLGSATTRIVGFSSNPDNQRNFDRENYAQSSRREFLTYALSLMRSHSSEHRDSLPVLDVTALRHIAYVLDGMLFYMRSAKENETEKSETGNWVDADENENDDTEDELQMACDNDSVDDDALSSTSGSRHTFFQRSESTLCLGCPPPDPFNAPMNEALPLADQPHLLQPNACRDDLFGIPKQPITLPSNNVDPPGLNSPLELPPTRLGLSSSPKNAVIAARVAHLASTYESQYSYGELSNDAPTTDDQPMSIETDDHREMKTETNEPQTGASGSASFTEPLPGSSKDTSSWRQTGGNIYVQLKKKTFIDFEESKTNHDSDKQHSLPDFSTTNNTNNIDTASSKMELDSDNDDLTDSESDGRTDNNIDDNHSASGSSAIRPQIIVKAAPTIDPSKSNILGKNEKSESSFNVFGTAHLDTAGASTPTGATNTDVNGLTVIAQSATNSGSPSKSVIVRAGPSVSFNLKF